MAKTKPAQRTSPWKLGGLTVRQLGARVWHEFNEDDVLDRAAALSYYLLAAAFPLLLFLTALLGVLPVPNLMDRLMSYVGQTLPPDAASLVKKTLGEVVRGSGGGVLSLGVVLALWAGSSGMASVMYALNVAYSVEDRRPWWKRRAVALVLTVGFCLFLAVGLLLLVFGPKVGGAVAGALGLGALFAAAWSALSYVIAIGLVLVGIGLVYYLAPAVEQRWEWVTPGSLTALVLWLGASIGLRFYVDNLANYNRTYGSLGGVILLLLWLYLTGVALLLGAEVNSEIEAAAAGHGETTARAPGERRAPAA
jgi:membrane protein